MPMEIGDILAAIGRPNFKKTRSSMKSMLGGYVNKGQIFTRPRPDTFGLVEFGADGECDPSGAGAAFAGAADDDVPF